ncbi:MAG: Heat shock transcription factor [Paramarteilia canceri]
MDFDEAFLIEAAAQTPSSALPKLGLDFMHGESDMSNPDTANEVTHSVPIFNSRNPLIKKKIISDGQNLTHQISEFIHKVWTMVEDDEYSDFIGWTDSGDSIYLSTDRNTSEAVLPNFFKHKKLSSFVRQLNLYGFTKNTDLFDPSEDTLYFSHPNFIKNCPDLLTKITRKKSQFPQAESENQYHSQNSSEKRPNSILQANTK